MDNKGYWSVRTVVGYFEDSFGTTLPTEFEIFLEEMSPSISQLMNQRLIRVATEEEVRQALFMMHTRKLLDRME